MIRPLLPALNFKLLKGKAGSNLNYWILIYRGKDGHWVALCESLPGCISQGKTRKEAIWNMEHAIEGYMSSLKQDKLPVPKKNINKTSHALNTQLKVSARMCVKALSKTGFYLIKAVATSGVSGSIILRKDKPFIQLAVPECRRLDRETLSLIIKTSGLSNSQFMKLLYEIKE